MIRAKPMTETERLQAQEESTARALLVMMPDVRAVVANAKRVEAQAAALAKRYGLSELR